MEKSSREVFELPAPVPPPQAKKSGVRSFSYFVLGGLITLTLLRHSYGPLQHYLGGRDSEYDISKASCNQPDPLFPTHTTHELDYAYDYISSDEFKEGSIGRLSGAVQIPSESFDDLGPIGEDPRWEIMYKFADYLKKVFPRVHEHMSPEKVNTHGLVYTWEGSDSKLKPLLLMAHQDVVPVPNATVGAWTHPPFSG